MRISDSMLAANFLGSLNKNKEQTQILQNQIATNSKLNKPSDSPGGTSRVLRLSDQISTSETFVKNIENSQAFVQTTINTMQSIQTEVGNVSDLMTKVNNPVFKSSYGTFADQIDLTLKSLLDMANTEYDGKFIFGGTDFSQKPYGFYKANPLNPADPAVVNNPATGGATTPVMQNVITTGAQNVRVSSNITQAINVSGSDLFGSLPQSTASPQSPDVTQTDIFNTLVRMRDNLRNGVAPTAADQKIVADFNTKVLNKMTSSGEVMNRLNASHELLDSQQLELKNLVSKEKDVDVASAVIDLQNYQYHLELVYKMSASILPKSLLDYL